MARKRYAKKSPKSHREVVRPLRLLSDCSALRAERGKPRRREPGKVQERGKSRESARKVQEKSRQIVGKERPCLPFVKDNRQRLDSVRLSGTPEPF